MPVRPLTVIEDDPVLGAIGPHARALHFNQDGIEPPPGRLVVTSEQVVERGQAWERGHAALLSYPVDRLAGLVVGARKVFHSVGERADADRELDSFPPEVLVSAVETIAGNADVRARSQ